MKTGETQRSADCKCGMCRQGCCKGGACNMHGCCGHRRGLLRLLLGILVVVLAFALGFALGRHAGNYRRGFEMQRGYGRNMIYLQRGQFPTGGIMPGGMTQVVPFNQATTTTAAPSKTK